MALLALAMVFVSSIRTDEIPDNVRIAGVDVGGRSLDEARAALQPLIDERLSQSILLRSSEDSRVALRVAATSISTGPRLDEALEAARTARGRIGRLLSRFGVAGPKEIPLRFGLSGDAVDAVIDRVSGNLGAEPVPAQVQMEGRTISIRAAKEGRSVDRRVLVDRLAPLPAEVEVPVRVVPPLVTDAVAREARDLAEAMRARPRDVTYKGTTVVLNQGVVTRALTFTARGDEIIVGMRPKVLRAALAKPLGIVERAPKDARWNLRGNRAVLVASTAGNMLDAEALTSAIRNKPEVTTVAAQILSEEPEFTTEEARELKIREKISEFTTPYDCCQNRVVNIQRAAAILDGTIIQPGERFSLNEALGERTTARGFVEAPQIEGKEIKPAVGGGVSQVATTVFNAAFFGGLELLEHTPHSFYFSRYPRGREATVSWRTPDLVFRNNWDAAILLSVGAGSNAITVRMYSSKLGRRVVSTTGEATNVVTTKKIERFKPELEPGTRKVIQPEGSPGFSINYTRKVYRNDDLISDRTFFWTYQPENAIIEIGPDLPDEPPPTGTTTSGTTTDSDDGTNTTTIETP